MTVQNELNFHHILAEQINTLLEDEIDRVSKGVPLDMYPNHVGQIAAYRQVLAIAEDINKKIMGT